MRSKPDTLFLTPEAKSDITDILNYTIETWGVEQAKVYAEKLHGNFPNVPTPAQEAWTGRSKPG